VPDRATINADGRDLSFITLSVTDEQGRIVPTAIDKIRFTVSGPGEIVATDNGDPTSFEPFQSHQRNAFNGLCLVIVRAKTGQTGRIELKADADSLKPATISIQSDAAQ
jgi:beta-galactosidase